MWRLIKQFPVLSYGVVVTSLLIPIHGLSALGSGYDDQGLGTAAFLLGMLWDVVAFPYSLAREALADARDGKVGPYDFVLVYVIGFATFIVGEMVWQRIGRRSETRRAS